MVESVIGTFIALHPNMSTSYKKVDAIKGRRTRSKF